MKKLLLFGILGLATAPVWAQSTNPAPYCAAVGQAGTTFIKGVMFGTLNNVNTVASGYTLYNNLPVANITAGSSVAVNVIYSVGGGGGYGVWIDYNHNNTFEDNEKVAGTGATEYLPIVNMTTTVDTATKQITIPATAMAGATRMRVRVVENDEAMSALVPACQPTTPQQFYSAETEDYVVTIKAAGGTGIAEIGFPASIQLYPNPVAAVLNISNKANQTYQYIVVSATGTQILKGQINKGENAISVQNLANGIYYIVLQDGNNYTYRKAFVK